MTDDRHRAPTFFATPAELRGWLAAHHAEEPEPWVGFRKKGSGLPSITWPEAVDEALCVGWIDGVRKSIDDTSYMNRFTPRKARSTWSAVNINRARELQEQGLMNPAGRAAFEARADKRSGIYAYEQAGDVELGASFEAEFRANMSAWNYFQTQAPSYRKAATWWVVSARRDETRRKRLQALIDNSAQGRTVPPLTRPSARTPNAQQ